MSRKAKNPFEYSFEYYKVNPSDYIDNLKTWIISNPKGWYANFKKTNLEMVDFINSKYPQLNGRPFPEKLYWFINNLTEFPLCQTCHENPTGFVSVKDGYANWCCNKCAQRDPNTKRKVVATKIERFGVENNTQTNEFKQKLREKIKNRTPEQKKEIRDKFIATCNKIYDCDHPTKNKQVSEKIRRTQIERKSVIQLKSREGCFVKHGCFYTGQLVEKIQNTKITFDSKYGGHPFSMQEDGKRLLEVIKGESFVKSGKCVLLQDENGAFTLCNGNDLMENVGCCSVMYFDSKWEANVYVYCQEHALSVQYHPNMKFKYSYGGKTHWYFPDFLIDGKLYEVKGDHFFRINESTGQEEMYCPWRGDLSDEEYEQKCGLFEAKHQCMIRNGIEIIRKIDIDNLNGYFTRN